MKLNTVQISGVESLGRRDLGAVARVSQAKNRATEAAGQLGQQIAKVGADYVERKMEMEYDENRFSAKSDINNYIKEWETRERFDAEEIQDLVPKDGPKIADDITDDAGNTVQVPRKNIPAYEVYPSMLDAKIKGIKENYAKNISSPRLRAEFEQSMDGYYEKKMLQVTTKASDDQRRQEQVDMKKRAIIEAKEGNINAALKESGGVIGSDDEKAAFNLELKKTSEVSKYSEAIRTNDIGTMLKALNTLENEKYAGSLDKKENITEQGRLNAKLRQLSAQGNAIDKRKKEQIRVTGNDLVGRLEDGNTNDLPKVEDIKKGVMGYELYALEEKINRATVKAPIVSELYVSNPANFEQIIDARTANLPTLKAGTINKELREKAREIETKMLKDNTGVYVDRIIGSENIPSMDSGEYFTSMVSWSKEAQQGNGIKANPLPDKIASQLGANLRSATVLEKRQMVEQISNEVLNKTDRYNIFKQIDAKGAGNLSIFSDMLDRGDGAAIDLVDAGRKLRKSPEGKVDVVPAPLKNQMQVKMRGVFPQGMNTLRNNHVEAVLDVYAALAYESGEIGKKFTNNDLMQSAFKLVVGNVVEYQGANLLLPNNEIDSDGFGSWIDTMGDDYITQLGGIKNRESSWVTKGLRDGDISLKAGQNRGEYYLMDKSGFTIMGENDMPFVLPYEKGIPVQPLSTPKGRREQYDRSQEAAVERPDWQNRRPSMGDIFK